MRNLKSPLFNIIFSLEDNRVIGPVLTLVTIAAMQILSNTSLVYYIPSPLSLMVVVLFYSLLRGGKNSGLFSAFFTAIYLIHYLKTNHVFATNPEEAWNRIVSWTFALPIIVMIISSSKQKAVRVAVTADRDRKIEGIAEAIPHIVWTTNPDGLVTYFNQRWFDFTGLTVEQSMGQNWAQILHPEDYQNSLEIWNHALSTGQVYLVSYRLKSYEGIYRWHSARALPIKDQKGKIVSWVGTCTDIDDQKRASDILESTVAKRTSEVYKQKNFLESILNTVSERILVVDKDGKLVLANPNMKDAMKQDITNVSTSERSKAFGLLLPDRVTPMPASETPSSRALRGEVVENQEIFVISPRFPNGCYALCSASPIRDEDGNIIGAVSVSRDISTLKQTERELKVNRDDLEGRVRARTMELQSLISAIPQIVWTANVDGYHDFVNQQWINYTGMTLENVNYFGWEGVIHPEDLPSFKKRWQASIEKGENYEFECRLLRHSDQSYRWHVLKAHALLNLDGQITKWFGTYTDIHDHKIAFNEMTEAKKRVDTVVRNIDAIIFSINKDGVMTFADGKGYNAVGLRPQDRIGKSLFELYKDRPDFLKPIYPALKGERSSARVKINSLWHQIVYEPMQDADGNVIGATGIALNVHDQELAQRILGETQEKLKAILKHVPFAFWAMDLNRNIIFREGIGLNGMSSQELIGKNISEVYKDSPKVIVAIERVFLGESFEMVMQHGTKWYNVAFAPSFDEKGLINGISGITFDITDRKKIELDNNELEITARAANETSRLKSDFLANMSHEIRTPINGVIGMMGLLADTRLQDEQREYVESAKTSADALLTIINDILDFSKVEAGKLEFENVNFDLTHLFKEVLNSFSFQAKHKDLGLVLLIDPNTTKYVSGDPGRIKQVLNNLLSNAIKFTSAGQISVAVKSEGRVADKNMIRVEVKDTGIGIPKGALSRMFQVFSQADASTTRRFGGTGLGLSISKQLIEKMGGEIGVISHDGEGSNFWFTIALPEGAKVEKSKFSTAGNFAELSDKKFRVLVAEDNLVNQKIALKVLQKMGLSVEAVANGHEAIDALRSVPYDLVLMDCQMPELDGYEAARLIRSSRTLPRNQIPIVAMTANAIRGDKEKCLAAGMNDYISKPVKTDELFAVLKKWLMPDPARKAS